MKPSVWDTLAALRFLLAAIVVSCHLTWFAPQGHAVTWLQHLGGFPAVLGFLIISGYSIAHSFACRPEGFYRRRVLRIYPLYASAILFSLLPFVFAGSTIHSPGQDFFMPPWRNTFGNLFFAQTFLTHAAGADGVVWTLAVEVACYSAAPFLARLRSQTLFALTSISAGAFLAYPHLNLSYYFELEWGLPLLFLAWAWLAGFLFYRHRESPLACAALVGSTVILIDIYSVAGGFYARTTVAMASAIVAAAPWIPLPAILKRVMRYLGDLSYPLYLFHLPALILGWGVLNYRNPWLLAAFTCGVSAFFLAGDNALKALLRRRSDSMRVKLPTSASAAVAV